MLCAAYVFGEVLDSDDPIDLVQVAMVLDLPSEEVPWESHPRGTEWLVDTLGLDKGAYAYWWRSRHVSPVSRGRKSKKAKKRGPTPSRAVQSLTVADVMPAMAELVGLGKLGGRRRPATCRSPSWTPR